MKILQGELQKEIVYKKNKSKSVLAIKISNYNYINIYTLPQINEYDVNSKFIDVPIKSKKVLSKMMIIKDEIEIDYLLQIIEEYLKNLNK